MNHKADARPSDQETVLMGEDALRLPGGTFPWRALVGVVGAVTILGTELAVFPTHGALTAMILAAGSVWSGITHGKKVWRWFLDCLDGIARWLLALSINVSRIAKKIQFFTQAARIFGKRLGRALEWLFNKKR